MASETTKRLKAQARRQKNERKQNQKFWDRWFGRGIDGVKQLLADAAAFGAGTPWGAPPKPGRKRSGYTRHTGNGAHRTHKNQPGRSLAPNAKYRVYRQGKKGWKLYCSTADEWAARNSYQRLARLFGGNNLRTEGFEVNA